jgi:hypothetical protein
MKSNEVSAVKLPVFQIPKKNIDQLTATMVKFCRPRVGRLHELYHWDEPDPIPPPTVLFSIMLDWSSAEANIQLKMALHRVYLGAKRDSRIQIARWVVRTWGGVKNNHPATLRSYVSMCSDEAHHRPWKGIASYSKILAVWDPTRFAIFDARVAAALNAVQMIADQTLNIRFPIPPGQSAAIKRFAKYVNGRGARYEVPKKEVYSTYLQIIGVVAKTLNCTELYRIEMLLFALAPRLARQLGPPSLFEPLTEREHVIGAGRVR